MGETLHASCVVCDDRAILIRGASGSGKSALSLELISRGATLVADDRTEIEVRGGALMASAPEPISGMIEARHMGLLRLPVVSSAPVTLVVDMDRIETDRLPPVRQTSLLGCSIRLLHKVESAYFPAALANYLGGGEWMDT